VMFARGGLLGLLDRVRAKLGSKAP
jgi:hypothetical protein